MAETTEPTGKRRPRQDSPVREKILNVASELFYRDGIRAVGVDTVVAESGAAKTSLYRWFPTKDDLVAAFLEREHRDFFAHWDKVAAAHAGRPRQELSEHLKWLAAYITGPRYRGCPFLNMAIEFPESGLPLPGRTVAHKNKTELRNRFLALATAIKARSPDSLANQLVLLIDGACANSQVLGKKGPARALVDGGEALIAVATGTSAKRG
jgi:AcrR family transcriptional regulator